MIRSFFIVCDGSALQFEVFFSFFCIRCQDQIHMHECELCRQKYEHVRLIAVSLTITDRVTASCQGKGSRSHIHRCSNTINVIIVKKGMREKQASSSSSFFFSLFLSLLIRLESTTLVRWTRWNKFRRDFMLVMRVLLHLIDLANV